MSFSLLFPPGYSHDSRSLFNELGPAAQHDLGIDHLAAAFADQGDHKREIQARLSQLILDADVITYRQDILADLLENPGLVERLNSLFPVIDSLVKYSFRKEQNMNTLHEVTWRLGELRSIVDCIEGLGETFSAAQEGLRSAGLRGVWDEISAIQRSRRYQTLVKELPGLLASLRSCASVTIGVNLDPSLRPVEAALLSINEEPFVNQTLFNKLFGIQKDREAIAPLHSVPRRRTQGDYALPISPELGWAVEPMMVPLFADLAKVLEKTTYPIAVQLKQFNEIQSQLFVHLHQGLVFYLGAARLIGILLQQGLPVCRPQIAPPQERLCEVKESFNVNLALHQAQTAGGPSGGAITQNDIHFGGKGRIFILTGPNQGGKTTYMQGVGLVQVLAQVGCFVPGREAIISPVDQIFTHFPLEEKPETDAGRFGEEAMRIGNIFDNLTRHSLVLLNESLSSTSFSESLYLAQDILRIMRRLGARAIYSTHLHELGNRVDELNASVPGESQITSLVSSPMDRETGTQPGEVRRTYQVEVRPPLGQSYAREIAARYGISYEQLESRLAERGELQDS